MDEAGAGSCRGQAKEMKGVPAMEKGEERNTDQSSGAREQAAGEEACAWDIRQRRATEKNQRMKAGDRNTLNLGV
jgi:hypothetical protein